MSKYQYVDPKSYDLIDKECNGEHLLYPVGRQVLVKIFNKFGADTTDTVQSHAHTGTVSAIKTEAGVYLPQETKDNEIFHSTCGLLLAYGAYAWKGPKFEYGNFAEVGDWALFGRYTPKLKFKNYFLATLDDTSILVVTPNPGKLLLDMN
jgi:hypothetical protein